MGETRDYINSHLGDHPEILDERITAIKKELEIMEELQAELEELEALRDA